MWKELEYRVRTLEVFKNYKGTGEIMLGQGNRNSDIMLILPDIETKALENGNILESDSGKVLENILKYVGIDIENIYITSLYKLDKEYIRFNSNTTEELLDVLITEIMYVNPKYIVTVGEEVFNLLVSDAIGKNFKNLNININNCVGNIYDYFKKVLIPIYDILYISRAKKEEKVKIVNVLKMIKEKN
ncbi:uracil-DNA glycosylase family protein [Streptobacillus canis]|uniref:uracil-DNA glycosylase family protein n=1 Tax=Streptobacillus canis TaxID=2678686 RepID=UPI0012E11373|nr:uracil-DNA glycosylase family protein [Streptobacillus canis]